MERRDDAAAKSPDAEPEKTFSWLELGLQSQSPEYGARYLLVDPIGEGSFGKVFRAIDVEIGREVAYKELTISQTLRDGDQDETRAALREMYRKEANKLSSLDHPNIVPIFDAGETRDGGYYLVSKYIHGSSLEAEMKRRQLDLSESISIVVSIAKALDTAHYCEIVHGDVKPANILLDENRVPYLIDFGLAVRDSEVDFEQHMAGTPAYMSPEQARQESNRFDHRCDIYSLGVVLFELITGRRPFAAANLSDLLQQIAESDPPSPRRYSQTVPTNIESVCLRALARLAKDRYQVARDFAKDLEDCLADIRRPESVANDVNASAPVAIVPKGLRSFEPDDADFFLQLLPGPKDRQGIPESVRFWIGFASNRTSNAPSIGILHGPSGCGKSSLIKAGLIPRLGRDISVLFFDAMSDDFEHRIYESVLAIHPVNGLDSKRDLGDLLAKARQKISHTNASKLLIVIDQFEQYLHKTSKLKGEPLVRALRQCDGRSLQAILAIRSDYWSPLCRLLDELELQASDQNSRHLDLFDQEHARRVLALFGQSFGRLPAAELLTPEQSSFLDKSIAEMSENLQVIPIRLAIFTQMVQIVPWNEETLRGLGGGAGLVVTFLERVFSDKYADIRFRKHADAARSLLVELLPLTGMSIRDSKRARPSHELQALVGYQARDRDFSELINILDRELRFITPVDQLDVPTKEPSEPEAATASVQMFQLTHDFLVPSIRSWNERILSKTWKGRSTRRFQEQSEAWKLRPESRNLPTVLEWIDFRWFNGGGNALQPHQAAFLRSADRLYGSRILVSAFLLTTAIFSSLIWLSRNRAIALTERLKTCNVESVADLAKETVASRYWTEGILRRPRTLGGNSAVPDREHLHVDMALAHIDPGVHQDLFETMLREPNLEYVKAIAKTLADCGANVNDKAWLVFRDRDVPLPERFRAGLYLAKYDATSQNWGGKGDCVFDARAHSNEPVFPDGCVSERSKVCHR